MWVLTKGVKIILNNLKKYREMAGLSQAELCRETDIKQQAYSHYEVGRRELPVWAARKIGEVLVVDWWLLYKD